MDKVNLSTKSGGFMFVFKRKNAIIVSVLIITILTFFLCFGAIAGKTVNSTDGHGVKVVLDAGHGGIDNGVSGVNTGVKESELNLMVVKKLKNYFEQAEIQVVLTRGNQAGLYGVATKNRKKKDMQKRKEIIEQAKPTMVISIHMNKYSESTRRGAQVFFKDGDTQGKSLAINIQNSLNLMEQSVRSCDALKGDYYILNCSNYPSIIAECGFLSNPEDESLLISDEYQDALAYALFKGAIGYLAENSFNYF